MAFFHLICQALYRRKVGHIARHTLASSARRLYRFCNSVQLWLLSSADHNSSPKIREFSRNGCAYSATAAGYDGNLVLQRM